MKRYLLTLLTFALLAFPCAAWAKSIYPGHIRIGGPSLTEGDQATLGKYDLIILNKNHYNDCGDGNDCFAAIKAVNTALGKTPTKILVYYNTHNSDITQDCDNVLDNNTFARWSNDACSHSQGTISDNATFPMKTAAGVQITSSDYGTYFLNPGIAGVRTYAQEVITTDLVGKSYVGDGHYNDTLFAVIFNDRGSLIIDNLSGTPALYTNNTAWIPAINGFISAITQTAHSNGLLTMVNRGDGHRVDGQQSWLALESESYPPDYVLQEGGTVNHYGDDDAQFYPWDFWKRLIDTLDSIENSAVVMQCGTQLTSTSASGTDNYNQSFTFWDAFYMGLGGYYLFKKPGDIFSWTFNGNYSSVGTYFDEYNAADGGNLDFGSANGAYQAIQVSNGTRLVTIYKREFENGYVFVNPMSSTTAGYYALTDIDINAAPPTGLGLNDASVKSITHSNVLTALGSISDVTTISIGMNKAVFLRKPAASPGGGSTWDDENLVALYAMDNGAITTDTVGGTALTNNGTVANDAADYKEGDASATLNGSTQYLSIANADLAATHPFKDGVSPTGFSVFGFFKPTTATGAVQYLVSKWANEDVNFNMLINTNGRIVVYNSDASYVYQSRVLTDATWVFVAYSYDVATEIYKLYVYDYANSTGYQKTSTQDITAYNTNTAAFTLGAKSDASGFFTGKMDMWGVMKDPLEFEEMEAIRLGTYAGSFPSDWPAYATITIQGSKIAGTGSQGNIPVYLNQTNFPAAMFDAGGTNYLQTDGDDLRFTDCLDDPANCILPHELVSIAGVDETDDNEVIEVHVLVPLVGATDKPIYAWYGNPDADAPTDASQQSVWADYKAVYHFGALTDSTGNFDLSVGAGDAALAEYTTQTPPVGANWAELDGGDYLYSDTMDVTGGADAVLSVEFWWKGDTNTGEQWAMGQWDIDDDPAGVRGWGINKTSTTSYPRMYVSPDGNNANYKYSTSDTALGTETPVHMTMVSDDTSIKIYRNGALDDAAPTAHTSGIYQSAYLPFILGGVWDSDSVTPALYQGINGKLDEVRLMEGVISADRALTTYRNQSDPATFGIEDADAEVGPAILAMGVIYDGTFYDVDVNPLTHEFVNDDEIIIAWKLNSEAVIQAPHTITVDLTLVGRGITSYTNGTFALELLGSDYYLTNRYTVQDGDQVADLEISAAITVGTGGSITDLDARAFDLDYTAFGTDLGSVSIVAPYPSDNPVLIGTDYNTVTAWKTAVTTAMVGSNLTVAATTEPGALDMNGDDGTAEAPITITLSGDWTIGGALTFGDYWAVDLNGNTLEATSITFGVGTTISRGFLK